VKVVLMNRSLPRLAAGLVAAAAAVVSPSAAVAAPAYTVTALTITVTGIPDETTGSGTQSCDITADLYRPSAADAAHPVPAILTTNGFGGSKADQAGLGQLAAQHGYAVLSYSGLGFGGSGCKISLDDPSYDGVAGSQLVSFLGGDPAIAAKDANGQPVHVDFVQLDATAHDGKAHAHDPRVGMIGGSYGGQIQFAIADVDPRLDTIVPIITWNDLSYSLAPNNTAFTHGVTYADDAPGTEKLDWVSAFFGLGIADGLQGAQVDPSRLVGCPNFLTEACVAKAELDAGGVATPDVLAFARHASVESYMSHITIPTLLAQGEADTLFNLDEAAATYQSLKARGVPVKMIWQSWGHSHGAAAKGEYSSGQDALSTYEGQRFFAWFDHYLKGTSADTGPGFAYYRDWVPFSGSGPDTAQYGTAASFPVGGRLPLYLSGAGDLVASRTAIKPSSQSYVNVGGGVPTSYSETSALQGSQIPDSSTPPRDAPGTFTAWSTAPLTSNIDVAGIPRATVHVSAPTASAATAATELLFFAKIYDVAPDGSIELVHRLVAPVRVADATKPIEVTLPGIVHRFAKGHQIRFVMAATDAAYKNSYAVQPVTVTSTSGAASVLQLPVVSAAAAARALPAAAAASHRGNGTSNSGAAAAATGSLAATGSDAALPLVGLVVLTAGAMLLSVRRRLRARRLT
jgi:ABC-2 type transport system ATP-binding protein